MTVNHGGDSDLTASPTTLTFTTANWNTARTVTVSAAADEDADDGTATFTPLGNGGGYNAVTIGSVLATEDDTDSAGVSISKTSLGVTEGGTATYTVVLDTKPSSSVTVTVNHGGDSDLTASPTTLTFTTANWNTARTITVSAAPDEDANDGTATFTHSATAAAIMRLRLVRYWPPKTTPTRPGYQFRKPVWALPRAEPQPTPWFSTPSRLLRDGDGQSRRRFGSDGKPDHSDLHHGKLEHGPDGKR